MDKVSFVPTQDGKAIVQFPASDDTLKKMDRYGAVESLNFEDVKFLAIQIAVPMTKLRYSGLRDSLNPMKEYDIEGLVRRALEVDGLLLTVPREDNLSCIEIVVVVPIPDKLPRPVLIQEVLPEINEAMIRLIRIAQVSLMEGVSVHFDA